MPPEDTSARIRGPVCKMVLSGTRGSHSGYKAIRCICMSEIGGRGGGGKPGQFGYDPIVVLHNPTIEEITKVFNEHKEEMERWRFNQHVPERYQEWWWNWTRSLESYFRYLNSPRRRRAY